MEGLGTFRPQNTLLFTILLRRPHYDENTNPHTTELMLPNITSKMHS